MATATTTPLVETLLRLQIVEPARAHHLHKMASRYTYARPFAGELIRRDIVTPYQANQIFRGKARDLRMGRYLLLERLGEGGMGQVFKAKQVPIDRMVALKVIHKRLTDNPKALLRFLREIETAGRLSHPNIVHAFDAGEVDGRYYFAMEYVEGVDLSRLVAETGPLLVPQACDYIRQIALALDHAHQCGMVHRDVKPANLLVTRDGQTVYGGGNGWLVRPGNGPYPWGMVKILDMGLARWRPSGKPNDRSTITALGSVMGTPDFIAPEQARNSHKSDIRSDLYSLGCTMYFLLCGQPPFPCGNVTQKLLHHQFDKPKSVQKVRYRRLVGGTNSTQSGAMAVIPRKVIEVLDKLIEKEPNDRFQTPAELSAALAVFAPPAAKK